MKEVTLEVEELEERIAPLLLGNDHANVLYAPATNSLINFGHPHSMPLQAVQGLTIASTP